jgi:antitoxin PrlF
MEDKMPIAVISSKGQMTIPREVRKVLDLKPSEKVIIVVEGDQAIIKPLRGTLLDLGGSITIPKKEKPIDFSKIREEVKRRVAQKAARTRRG